MSYKDILNEKIQQKLSDLERDRRELNATWVAHAICEDHKPGLVAGDDGDFWRYCGYSACRDFVRRAINKKTNGVPRAGESTLPGFEHLQTYYLINRDGEAIGVHRDAATNEELLAKAEEYILMSRTCMEHAAELRRFVRRRSSISAL